MFYCYAAYLLLMSLLNMILMIADKNFAIRRKRRIPENVLLSCAVLGGAPGGLLAMYLVRHKTKHWYFVLLMSLFTVAYSMLTVFLLQWLN